MARMPGLLPGATVPALVTLAVMLPLPLKVPAWIERPLLAVSVPCTVVLPPVCLYCPVVPSELPEPIRTAPALVNRLLTVKVRLFSTLKLPAAAMVVMPPMALVPELLKILLAEPLSVIAAASVVMLVPLICSVVVTR
jgi:hypothetical protein